jgi:hypothetical protein
LSAVPISKWKTLTEAERRQKSHFPLLRVAAYGEGETDPANPTVVLFTSERSGTILSSPLPQKVGQFRHDHASCWDTTVWEECESITLNFG